MRILTSRMRGLRGGMRLRCDASWDVAELCEGETLLRKDPFASHVRTTVDRKPSQRLMKADHQGVARLPFARTRGAATPELHDYLGTYIGYPRAGHRYGRDSFCQDNARHRSARGSGVAYWQPMAERYGLNIEVVNPTVDPTFRMRRASEAKPIWGGFRKRCEL